MRCESKQVNHLPQPAGEIDTRTPDSVVEIGCVTVRLRGGTAKACPLFIKPLKRTLVSHDKEVR